MSAKNILVVEDEIELRGLLADELRGEGYNVYEAEDGVQGYQYITTKPVDLVISDIHMPNMDGVELLKESKAYNPEKPVLIFVTGYSDLTPDQAYDLGASGLLNKPYDFETLMKKVHRCLDDSRLKMGAERLEVDLKVDHTHAATEGREETKIFNIGQGGMFIASNKELPEVDDLVEFNLELPNYGILTGAGRVRWSREKSVDNLKRGFGIEFEKLTDETYKNLKSFLAVSKTKAFIPKS